MTIYVDNLIEYNIGKTVFGSKHWCHMATDSDLEELHAMAKAIGLKRKYFQEHHRVPHYDLTESKRILAIRNGALEVTGKQLFTLCMKGIKK